MRIISPDFRQVLNPEAAQPNIHEQTTTQYEYLTR